VGRKVGVTCPVPTETDPSTDGNHAGRVGSTVVQGAKLEVKGKTVKASAIAHTITFDDPGKKKRTAMD